MINGLLSLGRRLWRLWYTWVPVVFFAGSLCLNVYLVWARHKPQPTTTSSAPSQRLRVGQKAPTLSAEDLDGHRIVIDWKKRPTLVYIFREGCSWCARNMSNIEALSATPNLPYRVVGVSLSDEKLHAYVADNSIAFPVYKNARTTDGQPFTADGTPETLLVSSEGMITERWLGAYGGDTKNDIEQKLTVTLPGVASE